MISQPLRSSAPNYRHDSFPLQQCAWPLKLDDQWRLDAESARGPLAGLFP